ncbi:hypothetical protein [Parapedobacter indicus]|uniref:PQQ-like domain-containing protein n=1 Tax=Parapedobacter indicus TaxID=1477437 RepID=A0A1I3DAE2_9SPHI|nr:hypothetical protein [Parapedobacter indicus]PPL04592.1 hypothetical protein CLV26_101395 [Parapedobacter indicus]SFH83707.1 hypothetical protein SAMN05444682_101382 [Parapedobacter indicus]
MRNLIIITSAVFIAIIVTSYFYFSNLGKDEQSTQEGTEINDVNTAVTDGTSGYPAPLWTFDLNAEPVTKPMVFFLDDSRRFILVQDAYHILYAVSATGEKLWNAQLPGKIVGNISQLSDSSILFTTAERLYRIDREGDPFPGFSLRLPRKADGDGAMASDETNGNIRIDVQAGNHILSFDGRGRHLHTRNSRASAASNAVDKSQDAPIDPSVSLPTGCGLLSYYGFLSDEEVNYLLCGNDRKLYCYRYD